MAADDKLIDPSELIAPAEDIAGTEDTEQEHRLQGEFQDPLINMGEGMPPANIGGVTDLVNDVADAVSGFAEDDPTQTGIAVGFELRAIADLGEGLFPLILSDLPFESLVEKVLHSLAQAINVTRGTIFEYDHGTNEFFARSVLGSGSEAVRGFRIPCNEGVVGHVADAGEPIIINDLPNFEGQQTMISRMARVELQKCVAAPIYVGETLYGVVQLFDKPDGTDFTIPEQRILCTGVNMAAKVLEVRFFCAELTKK